jgi:6-pyruvoyltetrahydropterin/6-carboxytetrahydropterin synthase
MSFELTQRFMFEAAHTLEREHESTASRRIHGHSYRAEVTVRGAPDPATGMVVDLALLRTAIAHVRERLDHHFLDDVQGLGPATLENLCRFVHAQVAAEIGSVVSVTVERPGSGDRCTFRP